MMSDPFEVLRTPDRRVEPDVEFRRRVMLDVDVAIDSHDAMTAVDERQEMTLEETDPTRTTGHGSSLAATSSCWRPQRSRSSYWPLRSSSGIARPASRR